MRTNNVTYAAIVEGEGENQERSVVPEKKVDKDDNVVAVQTFIVYEVDSLDEFIGLVPDAEEQANIINRAIVLKQQSTIRGIMGAEDFTAVEGNYDLRSAVGEKRERRAATPEEKLRKALSGVSPEALARILAEFQAAAQPTA